MKTIKKQKTNIWFVLMGLCFVNFTIAQSLTQTVKGKILDATTKKPLSGAIITLLESDISKGTVSDSEGFFKLKNVWVGRQSFLITSLGYEEVYVSEILVGSAKEVFLNVYLEESLNQMDEVIVVAKKDPIKSNNKLATVSARSFSVAETKRFPASVTDPSRMALSFAGVTNSDDESNEIIIRGNAPDQLLWKVEEVEVPNPNHFSEGGNTVGTIGMISTNVLGNSDFFTGAFPAEYGNATSGVFDIGLRNGNTDKNEYAFQCGILGTDIALEGPFSKNYKGSYLVNYRYSTLKILNEIIEVVDNSVPKYQDLSLKINLPLSSKSNLSIWGIGGMSESDKLPETFNEYLVEDDFFDSKTYMGGINYQYFINDKSTLKAIISYSGSQSNYSSVETNSIVNYVLTDRELSMNDAFRSTVHLTHKFNAKTNIQAGMIYSYLNYDILNDKTVNGTTLFDHGDKGNGNMIQSYIQGKHRINKKITSTFGLHNTYFSVNKDFVLEPRAGISYKINRKHAINLGFGIHSRRMPLAQYFIDDGVDSVLSNQKLDLMQATHYVLGYDWRIIKNGRFKIEAYYQDINKVAIANNVNSTASYVNGDLLYMNLTDKGKAVNYGLELSLEKFFSNQYYFLLTTSLYDAKYKAMDNNWYNSYYNFNHTFNLVGGKEFSVRKTKNNIIGTSAKILLNGGKRGTPINLDTFNESGQVRILEKEINTIQYQDYFRLDVNAYYRINKPKVAHVFSLDIQNLTNRNNIDHQIFNTNTQMNENSYQLGLTPVFNYRIEF